MEISIKKLKEFIGVNGKYVKNHGHMFWIDKDSPYEEDYLCVYKHYVLVLPKNVINLDKTVNQCSTWRLIETYVEESEELTFYGEVKDVKPRRLMFYNQAGEEIYVQRTFFTEFINGAYSDKKGFADGITFTGSTPKAPIFMWNKNEDLIGMFLPIRKA